MKLRIITLILISALILINSLNAVSLGQSKKYPIEPQTTKAVNQYQIVDTGQVTFFNNHSPISKPSEGQAFYGQDAQYTRNAPSYKDNGDGTITDLVTGMIWQKAYEAMTYEEAIEKLKTFNLAGKTDWRLPTIKQAYSFILFSGKDVSSKDMSRQPQNATPFIDTHFFDFKYGSNGQRVIDTQILSSTVYRGTTMGGNDTVFGVNVADGRIKGYPLMDPRSRTGKEFTVRFVRGNTEYGKNNFRNNQNGTISDLATGLMWQVSDSKKAMSWEGALKWAQQMNKEKYLGYSDWRLPNAKELQSIVDYSRSPQKTDSAAINPIFEVSKIKDEGENINYPFYWSSTTHENMHGGDSAVYVAFGEALGFLKPPNSYGKAKLEDVHGAGAQRSDPKTGDPSDYPEGHGPQGDVIRIFNYARLVRDI